QQCPADGYAGPTTVLAAGWAPGQCRAPRGSCDAPGTCPSGTAACPANQPRASTYVCSPLDANGACNGVTTCNGGLDCPPLRPAPAGTLCRASAGQCDVDDRCDGVTNGCPNTFIAANIVCDPTGVKCSGTSALCVNGGGQSVGYATTTACQ